MSSRNQPSHFAKGLGQFTPWKHTTSWARREATRCAKPGKYVYGTLVNGKFVSNA